MQGNTISPLIFWLAFNLLIELGKNLPSCGFSMRLPIPDSSGCPSAVTAIYVEWNEYSYHISEILDLYTIRCERTRKGHKTFSRGSKVMHLYGFTSVKVTNQCQVLYLSRHHCTPMTRICSLPFLLKHSSTGISWMCRALHTNSFYLECLAAIVLLMFIQAKTK